jgi:hypothetical protein
MFYLIFELMQRRYVFDFGGQELSAAAGAVLAQGLGLINSAVNVRFLCAVRWNQAAWRGFITR